MLGCRLGFGVGYLNLVVLDCRDALIAELNIDGLPLVGTDDFTPILGCLYLSWSAREVLRFN